MDVDTKTLKIIAADSPDLLEAAGVGLMTKSVAVNGWFICGFGWIDEATAEALLSHAMVNRLVEQSSITIHKATLSSGTIIEILCHQSRDRSM